MTCPQVCHTGCARAIALRRERRDARGDVFWQVGRRGAAHISVPLIWDHQALIKGSTCGCASTMET